MLGVVYKGQPQHTAGPSAGPCSALHVASARAQTPRSSSKEWTKRRSRCWQCIGGHLEVNPGTNAERHLARIYATENERDYELVQAHSALTLYQLVALSLA